MIIYFNSLGGISKLNYLPFFSLIIVELKLLKISLLNSFLNYFLGMPINCSNPERKCCSKIFSVFAFIWARLAMPKLGFQTTEHRLI